MESWFSQARRLARPLKRLHVSAETTLDTVVARPADDSLGDPKLSPALEFTMKIAQALLGYGLPVHRLEESLLRLSRALGFQASYYITPTGLIFTFGQEGDFRTRVIPGVPGQVDLERLSALHELIGRVERREVSPADATGRVADILARPSRYSGPTRVGSFGLVSVAAATLLGGDPLDLAVAALLGVMVGLLSSLAGRSEVLGRLLPVVATALVSVGAISLQRAGVNVQPSVLLLAAIMSLLPGLTMTIGMMELATANLVSGTARISGALVTFLQLGLGVALGYELADALFVAPEPQVSQSLPVWTHALAPVVAAAGFTILLRVRPRDVLWVLLTCGLAVLGSRTGGELFGAEVGAFTGAFLVGLASHLFARWKDRPALVALVPGILMMVPGSIGFLGISALLEADTTGAVQTVFQVLMVATALSTGVLLATIALPPRRSL